MGKRFEIRQDDRKKDDNKKATPKGPITCQRSVSFITAFIYGIEGRSSKSGRRLGPTTASISAWAFFWTSGYNTIARKNTCTVEAI